MECQSQQEKEHMNICLSSEEEEGEIEQSDVLLQLFGELVESWLEDHGESAFAQTLLDKRVQNLSKSTKISKKRRL